MVPVPKTSRKRRPANCPGGNVAALFFWLAVLAALLAASADPDRRTLAAEWRTGSRFDRQMQQVVGVRWAGAPLRGALKSLCGAQRVAHLLDRRVDPGQPLELVVRDVPLGRVLEQIAEDRGLGVSLLGPVVFFGPPDAAARLRTLAAVRTEEARRLPAAAARKFLLPERLAWDDFAMPRELVENLAREGELRVVGLERLPHDLWAAADLPPLSLVDRLTLIAVQFDLTFAIAPDGDAIALVPLPPDLGLVRSYPGGSRPQQVADEFASRAPGARIKVVGEKVYVKALLEDHERLSGSKRPAPPTQRPRPAPGGETRIERLRLADVPVGAVLERVCRDLNLQLAVDGASLEAAGASLAQRVSVHVEDVTVDELLEAIVRDTPLRVQRQGRTVEVRAEP